MLALPAVEMNGHQADPPARNMCQRCTAAEKGMKTVMSEVKAMDRRLDDKLATMNASIGQERIDAMAAVINEMVNDRKEMEQQMMAAHRIMVEHMMQHMAAPRPTPASSEAPQCPMMKAMQAEGGGAASGEAGSRRQPPPLAVGAW
jgi:hypothetical protein